MDVEDLEARTQTLLATIADRKRDIDLTEEIQRLYKQLGQLEDQTLTWVFPPDDPLWTEIEAQKAAIKQRIKDLEVIAPFPVLRTDLPKDSEEFWAHSVVASPEPPAPTPRSALAALLNPLSIAVVVVLVVLITLVAGSLRLSQSRSFSINRPFISQPLYPE